MARLLLASQYAFYPLHWDPFAVLCEEYDVAGSVIAPPPPEIPSVHRQLGWVDVEDARNAPFAPDIRLQCRGSRRRQRACLASQLKALKPDVIWIQEEPTSALAIDILRFYRHDPRPRIGVAICENKFRAARFWKQVRRVRAWNRINCLLATATTSVESIRKVGMPVTVPAQSLIASAHAAPEPVVPLPFDKSQKDFVVGFAGRICAEKGWEVLLDAMDRLPANFKVVLAGGGPEGDELQERIQKSNLSKRATYFGLLSKSDLWRFYALLDCLAVPSLTTPQWAEQFGGVLADAMAMGVPIVGSDSGSIPEVVGPAGLIVPEGDAQSLAAAIRRLDQESDLLEEFSLAGRNRFSAEFSISAYARKIAASLNLQERIPGNVAA